MASPALLTKDLESAMAKLHGRFWGASLNDEEAAALLQHIVALEQRVEAIDALCRMHGERRMVGLESVLAATNDSLTQASLQWRASAISDEYDTVYADGSTPEEAVSLLLPMVCRALPKEPPRE